MPGFITDQQLLSFMSDMLAKQPGSLIPQWQSKCSAANAMAWAEIRMKLLARGYSYAQVQAWDDGPIYQQMVGMGLALDMGIALDPEQYKGTAITAWHYRKNLATVPISNGNAFADPAGTVGQAVAGPQNTDGDLFVVDDTHEPGLGPGLGQPAEF